MSLSVADIVALIQPVKERAGDDAWREAMALLEGGAMVDPTEWITVDQAAGYAGISPRQMWRWVEQDRVRSEVTPSGRRRVDKTSAIRASSSCLKMS